MSTFESRDHANEKHYVSTIVVVFGASGDLAHKKTFPALFQLFQAKLLPENFRIIGYARSLLERDVFVKKATSYIKAPADQVASFMEICEYMHGSYDNAEDFVKLRENIEAGEEKASSHKMERTSDNILKNRLRIYYMALPPSVFLPVSENVRKIVYNPEVENHLVVEKPFGFDQESSRVLNSQISKDWLEAEIFRTDHYLGKEMVKNIMALRFANTFYEAVWNKEHISNVQITFREPFGTEGRGGYFDQFGIIRDVMQNHLMQVLSILAMEQPASLNAEDVRDSKTAVLKCIPPIVLEETLLGQYTKSVDGTKPGYLDDDTVNKESNTPTFAEVAIHIDNDRWRGVPFIMKAAKAVDVAKVIVRIQFKDIEHSIIPKLARNELVIQISPEDKIYLKTIVKEPGLSSKLTLSDLNLSYSAVFDDSLIPEPYASLLLDVIGTDHSNFVRADELDEAWRIFTPILKRIENEKIVPLPYPYGSRGPEGESDFHIRFGHYKPRQLDYKWFSPEDRSGKYDANNKL
ncbi:Glucose-6-phosphate 1-dehydrogenase [Smittium mucronatum]|uniref:Glucose-6-phosphate 1-dehydrogenase n=1 Tax=Smittium mucronatum TaxID=133383 RepID=A0A1R0GPZ9_9FUNG|nr:Glucose-6-phosphate 1-dehydrogenase [Smittium mucronatum]